MAMNSPTALDVLLLECYEIKWIQFFEKKIKFWIHNVSHVSIYVSVSVSVSVFVSMSHVCLGPSHWKKMELGARVAVIGLPWKSLLSGHQSCRDTNEGRKKRKERGRRKKKKRLIDLIWFVMSNKRWHLRTTRVQGHDVSHFFYSTVLYIFISLLTKKRKNK